MKSMEELRSETIKRLEYGYSHGEISLEEYERRIELVINTSNREDLERAVADLENLERENQDNEETDESIVAFLSSISRKGRWKPAKNNRITVFMGNVMLDFTEVELHRAFTDFEYFTIMGSIELRVPDGINLELNGLPVMASIDNKVSHSHNAGHPTIRVHGTAFMSSINARPPRRKKRRNF